MAIKRRHHHPLRAWKGSIAHTHSRRPILQCLLMLLLSISVGGVTGQGPLEGRLVDAPRIQCGEARIRVSIRTTEAFGGNVYAKGHFQKEVCRVTGNGLGNSANITIPVNADCGMRRRRIINPKGLVLEMNIMVMFHPRFLTRNDRAYKIECMYLEIERKVTNRLDISALPSTELSLSIGQAMAEAALPKCRYEVLSSEVNGHILSFASIGQEVYHRWVCQSQVPEALRAAGPDAAPPLYCLTVHSCAVDDGQGSIQQLLDSNGCPLDRSLLGPINYSGDLEAGRIGYVFKFADQPTIYFACQLRLEPKEDWGRTCKRTSDHCGDGGGSTLGANGTIGTIGADHTGHTGYTNDPNEEDSSLSHSDFPRPSPTVTPPSPIEHLYSTVEEDIDSWRHKVTASVHNPRPQERTNGGYVVGGQNGVTFNGSSNHLEGQQSAGGYDLQEEGGGGVVTVTRSPHTLSLKRRTRRRPVTSTGQQGGGVYNDPELPSPAPSNGPEGEGEGEEEDGEEQEPTTATLSMRAGSKGAAANSSSSSANHPRPSPSSHSVDMDVAASGVEVLDVQIPLLGDLKAVRVDGRAPINGAEGTTAPTQHICISRHTLSATVFIAILLLLLIISLFLCVLFHMNRSNGVSSHSHHRRRPFSNVPITVEREGSLSRVALQKAMADNRGDGGGGIYQQNPRRTVISGAVLNAYNA